MIQPEWINMYCSKCKDEYKGFHRLHRKNVSITLDLEKDEYVFVGCCPVCYREIINKRSAFGR